MSTKMEVIQRQREWALSVGLKPDNEGYLDDVTQNLFRPMTESAAEGLSNGSGSELSEQEGTRAKIKAAHSSSALALNVFDYFTDHDRAPLSDALDARAQITSIAFERQYPTGLSGTPPNLDVTLTLEDGMTIAIESKFTEWMAATSRKGAFSESYFQEGTSLWTLKSLPQSQLLAQSIQSGAECFSYLDANQLLKHALGLANQLDQAFQLYYIYFDAPGVESIEHRAEIDRFQSLVGRELRFTAMSYQKLFRKLSACSQLNSKYLGYLSSRYFSEQRT